jgi:hypothetical protein
MNMDTHMSRRKATPAYCLAYTVIIVTGLAVMTMFYFFFIERSYLDYLNQPFKPMKAEVHAGDFIPLDITRCNSDSVAHVYTVSRTLERVNKKGDKDDYRMLDDKQFHIEPGCHPGISDAHVMPVDLIPDDWFMTGMAETKGALISHIVRFKTLPFKVLPPLPRVVPQGQRGETGATGAKGAIGKTGEQGIAGATGAAGAKGSFWGKP